MCGFWNILHFMLCIYIRTYCVIIQFREIFYLFELLCEREKEGEGIKVNCIDGILFTIFIFLL